MNEFILYLSVVFSVVIIGYGIYKVFFDKTTMQQYKDFKYIGYLIIIIALINWLFKIGG